LRKKIKHALRNLKFVKREAVIFWMFFLAFLIIISKVFSYTVLNYDYYKNLALKQQIWKVEIPVTRWNIYTENPNVLATSVSLNDLAIDPMWKGNEAKLIIYLRNIIFKELCVKKSKKDCKNNLVKFLKVLDLEDFEYKKEYILEKITKKLQEKLQEKKITSVLLEDNLTESQWDEIIALWIKWIYVNKTNLYINPEEITSKEQVAEKLSKIISILQPRIEELIRKRHKRFTPILSKLSIETSEKVEKYISEEKDAYKRWIIWDNDIIFPYIILNPFPQRYYPEWKTWSQIVWFVDNWWAWQYWLEWYFDKILKWNKGYIIAKTDIKWNPIDTISLKNWELFWKWAKIYSTIDRNIQAKVESILERKVKEFRANKWTVVIMNPKTWAIISMANYPSFNPNSPWDVYELEKVSYSKYPNPIIDLKWFPVFVEDSSLWKEFYYNSKKILLRKATDDELWNPAIIKYKYINWFGPEVYRNGAITDLYEPGSIMKAFTVAIWLDSWEITENSMYQDNWSVKIDQFKISNVSKKCLWYHTFWHALNFSCNVWMLRIAQRYWRVIAYNYLKAFWFDTKTDISLSWEVTSEIRELNHWSISNLLTSSYWLWIAVTPLQMATAYSVLANGWVYIKPHIVDKIIYSNWKELKYKPEEEYRVIKPKTSRIITKMLVDSINNWVAKRWNVIWYTLAWKTWTSQVASKWWYEKWEASTYASFAWFGPAEDPKFVIIVKLDRPRTSIYWGVTSSKIFKEIAEYLLDYYKIPKKSVK